MKAMLLHEIMALDTGREPLSLCEVPTPVPHAGEVLIEVSVCGVCHTELDEIEGRTPPPHLPVILGHEVVGRVASRGPGANRFRVGDRVGVGWIHSSSGARDENLAEEFRATGRDAHGGYAEFMTVSENYAYPIPDFFTDTIAAPLLCAGVVGFRALRLSALEPGRVLGLVGSGGSNHLVLQLAKHLFPTSAIFVFARDPEERAFAVELGASWAGETTQEPPEKCDVIIDTTPAWKPVVDALGHLKPGGRLVINAIRKTDLDKDHLLQLSYHKHLWMEKEIKSVANVTRFDFAEFLPLAEQVPLHPAVQTYPLTEANRALFALRQGKIRGAKVLVVAGDQR